jgi:hypothetical protein
VVVGIFLISLLYSHLLLKSVRGAKRTRFGVSFDDVTGLKQHVSLNSSHNKLENAINNTSANSNVRVKIARLRDYNITNLQEEDDNSTSHFVASL